MRLLLFIFLLIPIKAFSNPTLDEKIAQMIMVGFNGYEFTQDSQIYKDITELGIGGVILFDENADKSNPDTVKNIKNPTQLKRLTFNLQAVSKIPLFIGIDQEGGKVTRLSDDFNVSKLSAHQLGLINNTLVTYSEALKTTKSLLNLGINVNFVPCVDVKINPKSAIAKKDRIYSNDPEIVTKHAMAVINANKDLGILPVIKHFPGHGSATGDTHDGFVDVTDTYQKEELYPFQDIVQQERDIGVMTSHIFNSNIDNNLPLSLSKKNIYDTLRKKLGFKGIVFSDDLNMGALNNYYHWEDILINAINAGTNVLVIGNNLIYQPDIAKKSIEIIKNAVAQGTISTEKITDSYNKIMDYKKTLHTGKK